MARDWMFVLVLGGASGIVISSWSQFSQCHDPVHIWLLVNFLSFILFHILQYAFQWRATRAVSRFTFCPTLIAFMNLCLLYPFLWVWCVIGSIWYSRSKSCLPATTTSWWFCAWLIYSYIYLVAFGALMYTAYRLTIVSTTNTTSRRRILYHIQSLMLYFQNNSQNMSLFQNDLSNGLTTSELNQLSIQVVQPNDESQICTICLLDLQPGDDTRRLPCIHRFHIRCIDEWLLIRDICPNCIQSVRSTTNNNNNASVNNV